MNWLLINSTIVVFCFIGVGRAESAGGANEEVLALEAALQEGLLQLDFSCRYSLTTGTAKSLEAGLAGATNEWTIHSRATGLLAKQATSIRLSVDYEGGLKKFVVNSQTGQPAVSHASFDEMSNRFVQVRYSPLQDADYDTVFFSHRDERERETLQPGPLSTGIVTPFSPLTSFGTPLLLPIQKSEASKGATTTFQVTANADGSLTVLARSELLGKWTQERQGVVQLENGLPFVREMVWEIVATNRIPPFVSRNYVLYSHYDRNVPKQVLTVHINPGGAILCHLWKVIGELTVPAGPDAFTINVAQSTTFSGLSRPISALESRRVRLDDIAAESIGDKVFGSKPLPALPPLSPVTPAAGVWRQWLILANLLMGVLIFGVAIYRRRNAVGNDESRHENHQ